MLFSAACRSAPNQGLLAQAGFAAGATFDCHAIDANTVIVSQAFSCGGGGAAGVAALQQTLTTCYPSTPALACVDLEASVSAVLLATTNAQNRADLDAALDAVSEAYSRGTVASGALQTQFSGIIAGVAGCSAGASSITDLLSNAVASEADSTFASCELSTPTTTRVSTSRETGWWTWCVRFGIVEF